MGQSVDFDTQFGELRAPKGVQDHEFGQVPASKVLFTPAVGKYLRQFREIAAVSLLANALSALQFIWVMDEVGDIWIAFEELAVLASNPAIRPGFPRRKGEHVKKLGHPTLVDGNAARIAGELFLDEGMDGTLGWILNCRSGRYCLAPPPVPEQQNAVLYKFQMILGENVEMDDVI